MMNEGRKTRAVDEAFVRARAGRITEKHLEEIAEKARLIEKKIRTIGPLRKLWKDVDLCQALVRDYWSGAYREVPYWAIGAIGLALLYLINPVELIPDVIPFVGYLDDAVLIALVIKITRKELRRYREWKTRIGGSRPAE